MAYPKTNQSADYINEYIKNRRKSDTGVPESYSEWLGAEGLDTRVGDAEAIEAARRELLLSSPTYGRRADSLASSGLLDDGYARYLNGINLKRYAEARAYVRTHKNNSDSLAVKKYSDYLTEIMKERENIYKSAERELLRYTSPRYEDAYKRAVALGLSENEATELATRTTEVIRQKVISSAKSVIISKGLTENQAKEYALSLGLSELDADELSRFAAEINDIYQHRVEGAPETPTPPRSDYIPPSYSEFIKNNIKATLK